MRLLIPFLINAIAALLTSASETSKAPQLAPTTADGYRVPQPGNAFSFPRDHGSHLGFRIEWWYITGHLFSESDRRFGFQATFFRSATAPDAPDTGGAFGDAQIHLAHMSLLDLAGGRFIHEERLNRDGWDAAAATDRLDLRNGNWSLEMTEPGVEKMEVSGSIRGEARFTLSLMPEKPRVMFGEDGVSRKGADPTAASHYITFTRLAASGTLKIDGREFPVKGRAWMDHEISSSQLSAGQTGWDWCSLQLDDGWDVMAYRLRRADGTSDPFSTLAWVSPEGVVRHVDAGDFSWTPVDSWTSPATGGRYPVHYRLTARFPDGGAEPEKFFEVRPLARDQELAGTLGGIAYWEGACDVFAPSGQRVGRGYTELTGYAETLQGRF